MKRVTRTVVAIHGRLETLEQGAANGVGGACNKGRRYLFFFGKKGREDEVRGVDTFGYRSDPAAQPRDLIGAKGIDDMLEPALSAAAPALAEAQRAEGQGDVVAHHEQAFGQEFVEIERQLHGRPAEVHVGPRPDELQARALEARLAQGVVEPRDGRRGAEIHGEPFNNTKPDVMSGFEVLFAGISESGYTSDRSVRVLKGREAEYAREHAQGLVFVAALAAADDFGLGRTLAFGGGGFLRAARVRDADHRGVGIAIDVQVRLRK